MRHPARILFGIGLAATIATLGVAVASTLVPKAAVRIESGEVAIATLATLRDGLPSFVTFPDEFGLDVKARELRSRGPYHPMGARAHQPELPVWVVKSGDLVRAFIAIDPRNGCGLSLEGGGTYAIPNGGTAFHDVCHGSLYGLAGEKTGGPSPWTLDELVLSVHGGFVYADRRAVRPGQLVQP